MSLSDEPLHLCLKLDYPPKTKYLKLEASATVGDLKKEAAKILELKEGDLIRHEIRHLSFRTNVTEISSKTKDDVKLTSEGVTPRSTIVLTAPQDLKPQRQKEKKKDFEDEDEDLKEKFKGLKASMILKHLDEVKNSKEEALALEFIDIHATKVFARDEFLKITSKRLIQLVQRKALSIKEGDLFEACVKWAKAECKRQSLEDKADNLKTLLADVLPHIRFPCMTMEEVATQVSPYQLLSGEHTLLIFTYLGTTKDKQKKMTMPFPTKPREGRKMGGQFSFSDNFKHYTITTSKKGTEISCSDPNTWATIGSSELLSKGVCEWEIVLSEYDTANTYNVVIGVVPATYSQWSANTWFGSGTSYPGWGFVTGNGYKATGASGQQYYGTRCNQGDVVKCRLDLDKHQLEFFINNRSQGVAFYDVFGPVRAAVSLIRTQRCTLRFPRQW